MYEVKFVETMSSFIEWKMLLLLLMSLAPQFVYRCFRVRCVGRTDKKYSYYLVWRLATIWWWYCTKWPNRNRLKTRTQTIRIRRHTYALHTQYTNLVSTEQTYSHRHGHKQDKIHSPASHRHSFWWHVTEMKINCIKILCWDSERLPIVWMFCATLNCWGFCGLANTEDTRDTTKHKKS